MKNLPSRGEFLAPILLCAALFICLAIANPFVDSPFDDDWSYSHVALRLAQTGHFHYNGWGSPTILFQCAWAAIFVRGFGFSFNVLRFASLPFSAGFIVVTYFLGKTAGLRRDLAFFCALIIAVSPLFLPLAATFMTEPYACFFGLLCLYAAIRSAESEDLSSAIRWLWVLAVAGILGGSDRQTVWIAPMLLIPYLVWLRQSSRRFMTHSVAAYLTCLAALCFVVLNFSQKYAPIQMSKRELPSIVWAYGLQGSHRVVSVMLVAALMCLPALLCLLPQWRRLTAAQFGGLLLICLLVFDYLHSGFGLELGVAPFLGNILTPFGVLSTFGGLGSRPKVLHLIESYFLTFLIVFAVAVWFYLLKRRVLLAAMTKPVAVVFGIFAVSYTLLIVPGALLTFCYDRYALPLFPLLLICILLPAQQVIARIPIAAWACLLLFAAYGIATTHDYARNLAARSEAVKLAGKQGITRQHISAGLEQDGWTQLQTAGTILNVQFGINAPWDYNHYFFWYYTFAIKPDYVALSSNLTAVPGTAIAAVPFTIWVPPSKQAVYVVRREDIPKP